MSLDEVNTCKTTDVGTQLMVGHGNQTMKIDLSFVPSIAINNVSIR